jgi:hypothetical protein
MLISINTICQEVNYFETIDNNRIKIYYDYSGNICPKLNATFWREISLQKASPIFSGHFIDYNIKGDTILTGNYINGRLNGNANYYSNNKIVEEGNYINNQRTGIWKYYFEDGQTKKIAEYKNDIPFFTEFYDKKGMALVANGTGKYEDYININNGKNLHYKIKGNLKNSNLDGTWALVGITKEKFENGIFISGYDVLQYKENPKIDLDRLRGFYCQESVNLYKNYFTCADCKNDISWALYSIDNGIDTMCYNDFIDRVSNILVSKNINSGYFLIQFDITVDGIVNNLTLYTHYDNDIKNAIIHLINEKPWIPYKNLKNKSYRLYFPLIITDERIFIPNPDINTCNTESNYMNDLIKNIKN